MLPQSSSSRTPSRPPTNSAPDLVGRLTDRPTGLWGTWVRLTTPIAAKGRVTPRAREVQRRARLLSALQLVAIVLMAILVPRGLFPVLDPGTLLGLVAFGVIVLISIAINRMGQVSLASSIYVGGLALAVGASQLLTPSGKIGFEDLAGYDFLVIPIVIAGVLLPRRASVIMLLICVTFVIVDLGLAEHSAALDAYLPNFDSPFLSIYPVAIYPIVLMSVVAVIASLAAGSVAHALEEADRTTELEDAYSHLAQQEQDLERAIAIIQQVHSRVANGDLQARAPVTQDNPLLPLAISLNLMLERLARSVGAINVLEETDRQIGWLNQQIAALAQGNWQQPLSPRAAGRLAPVAASIEQWRLNVLTVLQRSRSLAEAIQKEQTVINANLQQILNESHGNEAATQQIRVASDRVTGGLASLSDYLRGLP